MEVSQSTQNWPGTARGYVVVLDPSQLRWPMPIFRRDSINHRKADEDATLSSTGRIL